ncbi:prenylated Rab acceptor protein 1-like [Oratosquilla oratoria]|uniref:prenylated Rab acceptor protein 1-like n=1 Tax=Oratosquilla oratoria TaxID=337810 RepID=UPI003F76463C
MQLPMQLQTDGISSCEGVTAEEKRQCSTLDTLLIQANSSIRSPLLVIGLAAALGGCHICLKNAEKKWIVGGHEAPLVHQYAVMGIVSLPIS